jgi:replication factor C large subunit
MWVEKYRPKTIVEVIGNEEAKSSFLKWLNKRKQKAVLLYGPAGIGKTALVYAAAQDLKYRIIEMNASETRTRKTIMKVAKPTVSINSLDKFSLDIKGSLLLFDEIDGIFGREDFGGVGAIVQIIKESKIPIVLTANNSAVLKLRPIKKISHLVKFRGVRIPLIITLLEEICKKEEIIADKEALEHIAQNSQGDVRSAVNDLQILCEGKKFLRNENLHHISLRNRSFYALQILQELFTADSIKRAKYVLNNSFIDPNALLQSIHDNIPFRYVNPEKLALAYDLVSKADIYKGRIGIEQWQLLPYFYELLTQSVVISPETFQPFQFIFPPTKFSLLNWTRKERILLENICNRISRKCHVSKKSANLFFIPFLRIMFGKESKEKAKIAGWLGLDERSINYLKNTP